MLSDRLKLLRNENDLSQKKLGAYMNLSPSTIGMYETGNRIPDTITLIRFANLFDVSVDYLLGRTDVRGMHKNLSTIDTCSDLICQYTTSSQKNNKDSMLNFHNSFFDSVIEIDQEINLYTSYWEETDFPLKEIQRFTYSEA